MKKFSKAWEASSKREKQRKYRLNAPIHIKRRFLSAALSKELKKKYNKNAIPVIKGDKVKIMRGQFKKQQGAVTKVMLKKSKVYIEGIGLTKKDGTKTQYPIHASNVLIIEPKLEDPKRKESLTKGAKQ